MNGFPWNVALASTVVALDVVAATRAVWRSQGVERTLAWLLAIIAFPGFGALAYLLLANPRVRRTRKRKRAAASAARGARGAPNTPTRLPALEAPLFLLAESATDLSATAGNTVEMLAGDERAFAQIENAVRSARRSVWAEYYLIRRDETGRRFLGLLEERARAGLDVRLLYDAWGSMGLDAPAVAAIVQAGGRAQPFHPINPLRHRWSLLLRNHRKLIVADGSVGFTGGMNVGDEYSGRSRRRGGLHFHDSHLRLTGPAVADLAEVFIEDWAFATGEVLQRFGPACVPDGASSVAILPSGPDQERNASALSYFAGLGEARARAYLSSPYFIPDEPTLRALECAALRGVDVRLLVPACCDVPLAGPAARSYYPQLLQAQVRVFEYQPSMLHAKTMVIDGEWCLVGSANLDFRSFRLNFELSAIVRDPQLGRTLEQRFLSDLASSKEISLEEFAARGFLPHAKERAARLLSPLL